MPLLGLYREVVRRRYESQTRADEIHHVSCDDGVRVAVKRFRARAGVRKRLLPVVCVPGLGADSTNFDAPAPYGFAPWLAEQGFDTWAVDLRGTGLSRLEGERWSSVTFDDFVTLDMPAVLEHVARASGAPRVLWVGHSMGGLVMYALLAKGKGARIRAGVTLGSPLGFPQGWSAMPVLRPLRGLGEYVPGLHVATVSQLLAPLAMRFRSPLLGGAWLQRFVVLDNIDAKYVRRLMYRAIQSIPRGLMLQFRDWIDGDRFRSADTSIDYRAQLAGCTTPMLVVGAPKDGLARLDAVERARTLLPHADFVHAGTRGGMSTDYGHIDLLFGTRAPAEVWPLVRSFLVRHDREAEPRLRVAA